jgi:hypothetical protein
LPVLSPPPAPPPLPVLSPPPAPQLPPPPAQPSFNPQKKRTLSRPLFDSSLNDLFDVKLPASPS